VETISETLPPVSQSGRQETEEHQDRFAEAALRDAKHSGLLLAVRVRWIALVVIAVMLPIINPNWEVLYFHALLCLFALIGWGQLKVGRVGTSRLELLLIFCDLALMTFVTVIPNPWSTFDWPWAMQYRFGAFIFFFVLLAGGTLAYSWRTVIAMGTWTAGLWTAGIIGIYFYPNAQPELSGAVSVALAPDQLMADGLDPNSLQIGLRIQELVVFLIVAVTLALTVRRSGDLLISHAALERERTNLARYFSPTVVEELSKNDEPLKQVRTQDVAVLFVDIVGFTAFADGRTPEEVIEALRQFHGRMENEVFRHNGTLDKYLGDGLMATFGTPFAGVADAGNALTCARAMIKQLNELNAERSKEGKPALRAGFGIHYGPVVLGDIGANRLEFAVLGTTVNVASRLEELTRKLGCTLVVSENLIRKAKLEDATPAEEFTGLVEKPAQDIRGMEGQVVVWTGDD